MVVVKVRCLVSVYDMAYPLASTRSSQGYRLFRAEDRFSCFSHFFLAVALRGSVETFDDPFAVAGLVC